MFFGSEGRGRLRLQFHCRPLSCEIRNHGHRPDSVRRLACLYRGCILSSAKRVTYVIFEVTATPPSLLAKHHRDRCEIWLIFFKKSSAKPTIAYDTAVEEAMCNWSASNRIHALRKLREGKLTAAGRASLPAEIVRSLSLSVLSSRRPFIGKSFMRTDSDR